MGDKFLDSWALNLYALPLVPVAFLILLTGLYIYLQNRKSSANISFFLLCSAIFLWQMGQFGVYSAKNPELALNIYRRIVFLGVAFIAPFVYFFSAAWLHIKRPKMISIAFIGAIFFYILALFSGQSVVGVQKYYWGYYPIYGPYNWAFLVFFFMYFFASFYNFISAYRRETQKVILAQIKLITIAFLVSFLSSLDYVPKLVHFELYPLGFLYVLFWISVVGYTIIKYKAMDIETVIHKTLMWFFTASVSILPFAILIYQTHDLLKTVPAFVSTLCHLSLLLGFYFYFRMLQPRLDGLFQRQSLNLKQNLGGFSQELVHLKDLRSLLQRLTRLLRKSLYVKKISIYLLDENSQQLIPTIAKGLRGLQPIPIKHPLVEWAQVRNEVIVTGFAEGDPEAQSFKELIQTYFEEKEAQVAIPLASGEKIIGMIHLGRKENLKRYTSSEINFLTELKAPVAIAFSNSIQYENVNKLYEQVQTQNQQLKELDRLKSEFLANTSHELRTPLNGILGLVESILDGADGSVSDPQRRHLQMIIESGANLKELINNLLELSRMESGQAKLNVKAFNVVNVADAVIALLGGVAQKKGLILERLAPTLIADVYGEPEKIQRLLMNLVGNAVKFTHKGFVKVLIQEESKRVKISVTDTGIGIASDEQKIIFQRFRQADGSATRMYEGTGLGLSIAKEIAQLHGSQIEVQSDLGQGSTFTFYLPKQLEGIPASHSNEVLSLRATEGSEAISEIASPPKDGSASGGGRNTPLPRNDNLLEDDTEFQEAVRGDGETILVIDDNEVNREVIKTRLQMHHYKVLEAVDGLDALEKMKTTSPDLVILDLMMPRMSGYDFCRKVRMSHSTDQLPVIMLTAKTDMGDKIYGLSLGANDYISKPFNKDELIARVGILIKVRKMTRELKRWNEELEKIVDERTAELAKTQEQLIQAEKLATIGTLAGGVAHEINNPLTAVLTNAQILKMGSPSTDDLETLSLIEEGAKRCQIIVQKLLKYSRQPGESSGFREIDLAQVAQNAVSMLRYQLSQDNIQIQIQGQGAFPVQGISNELEQVFTNLILNSRDAITSAERTEGQINIILHKKDGLIEAEVQDNGIGIKKEHLKKIFDPFFTTKEVGSGTGLGLAVTHNILQKHQVGVDVKSEEKKGTTFVLKFIAADSVSSIEKK